MSYSNLIFDYTFLLQLTFTSHCAVFLLSIRWCWQEKGSLNPLFDLLWRYDLDNWGWTSTYIPSFHHSNFNFFQKVWSEKKSETKISRVFCSLNEFHFRSIRVISKDSWCRKSKLFDWFNVLRLIRELFSDKLKSTKYRQSISYCPKIMQATNTSIEERIIFLLHGIIFQTLAWYLRRILFKMLNWTSFVFISKAANEIETA